MKYWGNNVNYNIFIRLMCELKNDHGDGKHLKLPLATPLGIST